MHRRSANSPTESSRNKQERHRDRSRSPRKRLIKSEPEDDYAFRKPSKWEVDDHRHSRMNDRRRSSIASRDSRGGRLREPVVIKQEDNYGSGSRLHSPKIIKEDLSDNEDRSDNRRSHTNSNLGRSGLLDNSAPAAGPKQKANFGLSGKLTEDTNTYKGVVIKYNEPADARKPTEKWRLYVFKGNQTLPILHIHRQSGFLIGRDRKIADIPMDHPSISKQHAVLQYRFVKGMVRLYIIDLESVNGTFLNSEKIEPRRYYELIEKDVIKFGFSTREYVVMTANVDDIDEDDDDGVN